MKKCVPGASQHCYEMANQLAGPLGAQPVVRQDGPCVYIRTGKGLKSALSQLSLCPWCGTRLLAASVVRTAA